jgi:hypothetical protein
LIEEEPMLSPTQVSPPPNESKPESFDRNCEALPGEADAIIKILQAL